MTTHELKTWPEFFAAVSSGDKPFELRKDDRGFRVGDRLHLKEYVRDEDRYTGHVIVADVTCVVAGPAFGLERGYVCMGIKVLSF